MRCVLLPLKCLLYSEELRCQNVIVYCAIIQAQIHQEWNDCRKTTTHLKLLLPYCQHRFRVLIFFCSKEILERQCQQFWDMELKSLKIKFLFLGPMNWQLHLIKEPGLTYGNMSLKNVHILNEILLRKYNSLLRPWAWNLRVTFVMY